MIDAPTFFKPLSFTSLPATQKLQSVVDEGINIMESKLKEFKKHTIKQQKLLEKLLNEESKIDERLMGSGKRDLDLLQRKKQLRVDIDYLQNSKSVKEADKLIAGFQQAIDAAKAALMMSASSYLRPQQRRVGA